MSLTRKIISAGPLVREALYPRINRNDSDKVRGEKKKASSAAQQRMNDKYCWQKCEMLLAANFVKGDVVGCLTYRDGELPATRKQVVKNLEDFRKKLSKTMAQKHKELLMVWSIEHLHGEGRWHVHFVCNAIDYKSILTAWGKGEVEMSALRVDRDKNYESIARYFCKEQREKVGLRAFSSTRSCKRPTVECLTVPDDTQLSAPKGTIVFERCREQTEYGRFEYIKYSFTGELRYRHRPRRR